MARQYRKPGAQQTLQWYSFEVLDKKDPWTRVVDEGDRAINVSQYFRTYNNAMLFLEVNLEKKFYIRNNVITRHKIKVLKLARNLYFVAAADLLDNKDEIWALVRVKKHIATVPANVLDEYAKKRFETMDDEEEGESGS